MSGSGTILIDRSRLFREGMKRFLANTDYAVVGESAEISEALGQMENGLKPRLVVLDFVEGNVREIEAIRKVRDSVPDARIVLLAGEMSPNKLGQALEAGVDSCLMKDISSEALIQYLSLVIEGERVFPVELAKALIDGKMDLAPRERRPQPHGLSPREIQILGCLINGDPNKVIANRLRITEATVKVHLKGLLKKINAANRTQAAMWAVQHGIQRHSPAEA